MRHRAGITTRLQALSAPAGFTLLELLVAISILALLAVFSWRTLDAITRTSDALKISSERVDTLARVFAALERDVGNASSADLPAEGELRLLAAGGSVSYRIDDDQLMRQLPGGEPGLLASGVKAIRIDLLRSAPTALANLAAANQAAQGNASVPGAGLPSSSLVNSGAGTGTGGSTPLLPQTHVEQPVTGVQVALTLDNGDVVTRLMLLNSV